MRRLVVVTHSHLDREWYRTAEAFRSRLVDTLDAALAMAEADPEFVFVLDGQSIVLEDFLELRPTARDAVVAAIARRQLSFGPWYVQPDGFIPSAESIVRNLLEGRAAGVPFGSMSEVGYLPDTFGHPACLPMVLQGFGLKAFCFRRGMGDAKDQLPSEFRWEAPDGSAVLALYLALGYAGAAFLPPDPGPAAARVIQLADTLFAASSGDTVALMNGCDHTLPSNMSNVLGRVRAATGYEVEQGSIDDVARAFLPSLDSLPTYRGELRGARDEALLHGVLSTRVGLKVANAHAEQLLYSWAEPFAALATSLGGPDERSALRRARRTLLENHAHDSICGTSIDAVHQQMETRFRQVRDLAETTADRSLRYLAGARPGDAGKWDGGQTLAVFNPNPYPVSGLVRHWFDADPPYAVEDGQVTNPPALREVLRARGFQVDGRPARLLERENARLFVWDAEESDRGVEFPVRDLPPFGWRKVLLRTGPAMPDQVDRGRRIGDDALSVEVADDGTFTLTSEGRQWTGLFGLADDGDRGDTYDFSPVGETVTATALTSVTRRRSPSGTARLQTSRRMLLPAGLVPQARSRRRRDTVELLVDTEATIVPGCDHVAVTVKLTNDADDHRLRCRFPLGVSTQASVTEGPYHVIQRPVDPPEGAGWVQPPPRTFPSHTFITVPGAELAVAAPGLLESEVTPDGVCYVTLLRAVGRLSDRLPERGVVGPALQVPGAHCRHRLRTRFFLLPYREQEELPRRARAAAGQLRCVVAGTAPGWPPGTPLLEIGPEELILTSLKPAEAGHAMILRLWNPSSTAVAGWARVAIPLAAVESVRLDEEPDGAECVVAGNVLRVTVPPHGLRTLRLVPDR